MEDDTFLTLGGLAEVRRATKHAFMRTILFHSTIGAFTGLAFSALMYFGSRKQTENTTLTTIVGIFGVSLAIPTIVHWVRHFSSMLRQLSCYEARVRNGESIPTSSVRFLNYREIRVHEAQQS